jgi:hypothetical protein
MAHNGPPKRSYARFTTMKTATSANEGPHFAVPSADVVEATGAKNTLLCTLRATINRQQATVRFVIKSSPHPYELLSSVDDAD